MAVNKYLTVNAGLTTEVQAPATSGGAGDAGKLPALDSNGKIDQTFMPSGIGPDSAVVVTSEALAAGDLVNIFNNAGAANARKADATSPAKRASGFVQAAFASGANATVFFEGADTGVTGLTPGDQFLSATTPGKSTATAPTTSGSIVQRVGVAYTATALNVEFDGNPIVLA